MIRARVGNCCVAGVNDRRWHQSVSQRNARFSTRRRHGRPNPGESTTAWDRADFTRAENTPHSGHGASKRLVVTVMVSRSPSSTASSTTYSSRPTITSAASARGDTVDSICGGPFFWLCRNNQLERTPTPFRGMLSRVNYEDPH